MPLDQEAIRALQVSGPCNECRLDVRSPSVHLCPGRPDEVLGLVLFAGCLGEEPGFAVLQSIPKRLIGSFEFERRPGEQTLLRIRGHQDLHQDLVFRIPADEELGLRLALS